MEGVNLPETAQAGAPAVAADEVDDSMLVMGFPTYAMPRDVEKFLAEAAPHFEIKRVRLTGNAVSVKMADQQTRDTAIAELNAKSLKYKHFALTFSRAWTARERFEKRSGKRKLEDSAPRPLRTVEEAVTPLHATPYEEQLVIKARSMRTILRKFATRLIRQNFGGAWLSTASAKAMSGGCCPQSPVVRAELVEGYRNKCEFAIGLDAEKRPCVGFMRGTFLDGGAVVGNPSACRNVSAEMKAVVVALQAFVSASPHAVYDGSGNNSGTGFWRMLLVRQTRKGELLVSIQVNPSEVGSEVALAHIDAATRAIHACVPLTCAYMQSFGGCSSASADLPHTHLWGERELCETLRGVRFRISPNAFFQVNTGAAEQLGLVLEELVSSVGADINLIDVCCGAGAWGLCLAGKAAHVVGIELCADAVHDARRNAEDNNVRNAQFKCGRAEDLLEQTLAAVGGARECVAIVDPPRAGLHANVIKALRGCAQLKHLIYVSCNPNSWLEDAERLCRPTSKQYRGDPFRPVRAIPIDLFPDTPHCELVVHMIRMPADQPNPPLAAPPAADSGAPASDQPDPPREAAPLVAGAGAPASD